MTGTTLPSPLFGIYEQRLHISSLSVTVIYGIYSIGVVGALAVLARFGSGIGLRTRLAAGLALSAASAAVFLVTTSLGPLIAARVLSGLAAGLTSGTATSAMIGLGGTDGRARSAAIAVGVSFGGLAVGSAVAGALSDLGSAALTLPFLIDLIASLAIAPRCSQSRAESTTARPRRSSATTRPRRATSTATPAARCSRPRGSDACSSTPSFPVASASRPTAWSPPSQRCSCLTTCT